MKFYLLFIIIINRFTVLILINLNNNNYKALHLLQYENHKDQIQLN
jgi:hypothetical protein